MNFNLSVSRNKLRVAIACLPIREKKILETRFGLVDGVTHTLEEVGRDYNVTRERIRQIEQKALKTLKLIL